MMKNNVKKYMKALRNIFYGLAPLNCDVNAPNFRKTEKICWYYFVT